MNPNDPIAAADAQAKPKRGCGFYALIGLGAFIGLGVLGNLLPETPEQQAERTAREAGEQAAQDVLSGRADAPSDAPAATKVTARALFNAYAENEVAAKAAYGDRVLEVTGTVKAIELDLTDDPVVRFDVGKAYDSVTAQFDKDATAQTSALKKGQQATVRCARLTELAGSPYLSDCALVP